MKAKTVPEAEIKKQFEYMQKIKDIDFKRKYYIFTLGCKLNEADSESLAGMMEKMGYEAVDSYEKANIVIINTCSIRENAEERVFGKLGELKNIKEQNKMIICLCGCMAQEPHVIEKVNTSYPLVDIIFGTLNIYKFPELLYDKLVKEDKKRIVDIWDIDGEVFEGLPVKRESKTQASVIIMNGCNNFCSYCIVPYVRGRERSRMPEDIIHEVKELANDGCKEILLLGQNVNSYSPKDDYNFANLLEDLDKIDGIDIIKFTSPHPKDFKDDVIDVIAKSRKISKVIHLPLQSGSSKVLKLMNRGYTKEQYLELAEKIKSKIPEVLFTTDIIVGFPGETEEDFEETLDVVRKMNYEQVFMFIYSVRKGTRAEKMKGHIDEKIKSERFTRLKELYDKMTEEGMNKYVGTVQHILVEGVSKTNSKMLTGRTLSNKIVNFEGDKSLIGKQVDINIVSQHVWYLKGEILK